MDRGEQLLTVAAEAQRRIDEAIQNLTTAEIADTAFDQVGLRDGLAIVEEHVRAGELGVAYDHLRYMLVETEIALSPASVVALEELAAALGLPRPSVPIVR